MRSLYYKSFDQTSLYSKKDTLLTKLITPIPQFLINTELIERYCYIFAGKAGLKNENNKT